MVSLDLDLGHHLSTDRIFIHSRCFDKIYGDDLDDHPALIHNLTFRDQEVKPLTRENDVVSFSSREEERRRVVEEEGSCFRVRNKQTFEEVRRWRMISGRCLVVERKGGEYGGST